MISASEPDCGTFDGPVHRHAVRVYHEDTDASGLTYHASYLRWFERARSDMLRLLGVDQREAIEAGDGFYAVADMTIRFRAPARLGDAVSVETLVREAGAASLKLLQIAMIGGTVLCEADVRVGFVAPNGKPRRQPESWRKSFAAIVSAPER